MLHMTGSELAESILATYPDTPIIVTTGYAELQEAFGSKLARIAKPFSQRQLVTAMREALGMGKDS